LPLVIGNIHENTIQEIWNGDKANRLRATILDGTYRYCNNKTCLYLLYEKHKLIPRESFVLPTNDLPEIVLLSVDESCNLYCPSCRTKKISQLDDERRKTVETVITNVFQQLFNEPHSKHVHLTFDGRGEVFNSAIYRNLFENSPVFSNLNLWPNLDFRFITNGVMMTEKIQDRYAGMFGRLCSISISVDAGNKESYDKVRLGGDWDLLWKNLDYLYKTQRHRHGSRYSFEWSWQVVLQEDNFESIPELINIAYNNYSELLPQIIISPILNWGAFDEETFKKKSVINPESKHYNKLKEILNMPQVANYPNLTKPNI
jgi:sulfatase maturation enzyme AslB (radical SAM superfamily)